MFSASSDEYTLVSLHMWISVPLVGIGLRYLGWNGVLFPLQVIHGYHVFLFHLYHHKCLWPWDCTGGWLWYYGNSCSQDPMKWCEASASFLAECDSAVSLLFCVYCCWLLSACLSLCLSCNDRTLKQPCSLSFCGQQSWWNVKCWSMLECLLKAAILWLVIMEMLKKKIKRNLITVLGLSRSKIFFWESGIEVIFMW